MVYIGGYGYNLLNLIDEGSYKDIDILDEWGFPLPNFYYEIACYDLNHDGEKEIIFAAGDKKNKLLINIFSIKYDAESYEEMQPQVVFVHNGNVDDNFIIEVMKKEITTKEASSIP